MGYLDGLEVVDYLRSGALVIGFLATVFADRKGESTIWLQADAFAGAALGAGLYLFPNILLDYQVTVKADWLTEHFLRVIGASLIAKSLIWYYSSGTKERSVSAAWLFVRSFVGGALFMLMFMFAEQNKDSKVITIKKQYCTFGLLGSGLWTLGNIFHLFRQNSFGTVRRNIDANDRFTNNILFHLLTVGILSVVTLAHPRYILSLVEFKGVVINDFHVHLVTMLQVMISLTCGFLILALTFNNDRDKSAFFKAYLWTMVLILPWDMLDLYKQRLVFSPAGYVFESVFVLAMVNAMCAVGCLSWIPCPSGACKIFKRA